MADCRVVWDREGYVSEIHVIGTGERSAKMIARDIQSLLLVNHNLSVPYQKVSIVNPGRAGGRAARPEASRTPAATEEMGSPGPPHPAAAPPRSEEAPEQAPRTSDEPIAVQVTVGPWRLDGLQLRLAEGRVEVTAELVAPSGEHLQGRSAGPSTPETMAALGARAVLEALAPRWEPFRWVSLQWVDLAGPQASQAVVVAVTSATWSRAREVRWSMGAALVQGNAAVAGALAALDALGKLSSPGGPAV
ncbi:MAG: hypothetical protein GX496_06400 [Firmicutes bacterium]|nr:hypothetical protein [Bacillota bacterium]